MCLFLIRISAIVDQLQRFDGCHVSFDNQPESHSNSIFTFHLELNTILTEDCMVIVDQS